MKKLVMIVLLLLFPAGLCYGAGAISTTGPTGVIRPANTIAQSSHYLGWWPMVQAVGTVNAIDESSNASDMIQKYLSTDPTLAAGSATSSGVRDATKNECTLIDTTLVADGFSAETGANGLEGGQVTMLVSAGNVIDGQTATIIDYNPTTRTLILQPAFSAAVTSGDTYRIDGPWRNPGWLTIYPVNYEGGTGSTTTNGKSGQYNFAISDFLWDMAAGESLVVAMRVKNLQKQANGDEGFAGNCDQTSAAGIGLVVTSAGLLKCRISDGTNMAQSSTDAAFGLSPANTETHLVITVDAITKEVDFYWNGAVAGVLSGWSVSTVTGSTQGAKPFAIGSDYDTNDSVGGQYSDIHILKTTGGLPSNIQTIVDKLYSRRSYPISTTEWP